MLLTTNPTKLKCIVDGHPELSITCDLSFGWKNNPDTLNAILDCYRRYGLFCYMGHVVISGQNVWMPTRVSYAGPSFKVTRQPGDAYFYAPGQTIIFTYGGVTESATIPKFGEVIQQDRDKLKLLGDFVFRKSILDIKREPVFMSIIPVYE